MKRIKDEVLWTLWDAFEAWLAGEEARTEVILSLLSREQAQTSYDLLTDFRSMLINYTAAGQRQRER